MQFFVYAHLNPITLQPFYIGKGKGKRHLSKVDRSNFWNNIARKYGFIPVKLVENISNENACEIEKQYIKKYGFKKTGGFLVNHTAGGNGGNTFDPISGKNWNSGKTGVYSTDTLSKLRASKLGKKLPAEQKAKVLIALKKAAVRSIESRTHKVTCLITGKVWNNRNECISDLGLNIKSYAQRVFKNKPIKGYHLQLIKK